MRNPNYDHTGFAMQVNVYADDLSDIDSTIAKFSGRLLDTNDAYFPYATDHAAETLAHTAKRLRELADRLEGLIKYTNYPPVEHQGKSERL